MGLDGPGGPVAKAFRSKVRTTARFPVASRDFGPAGDVSHDVAAFVSGVPTLPVHPGLLALKAPPPVTRPRCAIHQRNSGLVMSIALPNDGRCFGFDFVRRLPFEALSRDHL